MIHRLYFNKSSNFPSFNSNQPLKRPKDSNGNDTHATRTHPSYKNPPLRTDTRIYISNANW